MSRVKVEVKDQDRKTLVKLVRAERKAVKIDTAHPVTTAAQQRAVEFYQDHLLKLHKRLDPNDKNISNWNI